MMQVYYNEVGLGDKLIIQLAQPNGPIEIEDKNKVTVIKSKEERENIVGLNLFDVKDQLDIGQTNGMIQLNEKQLSKINELLESEGINVNLNHYKPSFVVGYVQSIESHPDADKLSVTSIDVGEEDPLQIVCGAPNVQAGKYVVVATVGSMMPSGMAIKPSKLRGVESNGMLCSLKELGYVNAPREKGIYLMDEGHIGHPFSFELIKE